MMGLANSGSPKRPLLWLLFSWHLLSMFLLCILIAASMANTSTSADNAAANAVSSSSMTSLDSQGIDHKMMFMNDNSSSTNKSTPEAPSCDIDLETFCPDSECKDLHADCIQCDFNTSCPYGSKQKAMCAPKQGVNCTGARQFEREYECRYCYQLLPWQTWCNQTTDCSMNKPRNYYPARPFYLGTCYAQRDYLCLGRRCFYKQLPCNWSQGYKWSTALLLSVFLGGFGVDRFYLGLWKEALGKLLTFGGLGVWTIVDVILIAVGYIGPLDGSLYI